MPGLDTEDFYESDSSDNEENHSKLLNHVSQLDNTQRVKPAQRKEIASEVSEYNLGKGPSSNNNLVNVKELIQVLGKKSKHADIKKKITKITDKVQTLPKPLEKPVEERLKRSIGFENVKKQLGKWDAIVTRNALKDSISFPLNDNSMHKQKSNEFLSQFKTKTPLEEEISKVLKQENIEDDDNEDKDFPLTLEEMMEKRKEMATIRAKLSYKQTKAQRQSKIKSKKYHRLLKREKLRQQLKEFELLQKTDPEAALKKLEELDKTRAQERASLRHKNTGQWAKNLTVRAKYDVETRKVLAEQLKISRELTQKVSLPDSSDDDEELADPVPIENIPSQSVKPSTDNPWTLDVSKEVQDFISGYKKYWSEKGEEIDQKNTVKEKMANSNDNVTKNTELVESKKVKNKETQNSSQEKTPKKLNISSTEKLEEKKTKKSKVSLPEKLVDSSKKKKTSVTIHPTSGVWIVTPVEEEEYQCDTKNKRKADEDIDTLFDELNDELMKKATNKINNIKNELKKSEKKENTGVKEKKKTEFDLTLKNKVVAERPDADVGLLEGEDGENITRNTSLNISAGDGGNKAPPPAIDPKNFIQVKPKRLRSHMPDNITGNDDALDDEKAQQMIIEEAFGDDDVMAEFKEMKEEEEKSSKIEIDSSLPGWGEWGGLGIKPKRRKKRLLVLNVPPRKDKLKKDVIINEKENPNLKQHFVKEVPHPFKSVDSFEANIRAPIGRDWVPETAHQKLIQKQVITKLGTIIDPMDEDEIVRLNKSPKSPYQGKKKKTKESTN